MAKRFNKKAKRSVVAIVMLLVFVFIASIFVAQTSQLTTQAEQIRNIDLEIQNAQKKHDSLVIEQSLIGTDEYKKDVARTRDGLVLPNEMIFVDGLAGVK